MKDNELPTKIEEPPMTTVHQALAEASAASQAQVSMKNFSVRLPEALKEACQVICERHGTDLGSYLRECARGLVRDYGQEIPDSQE